MTTLRLTKQIEIVDKANHHFRGISGMFKNENGDYEYAFIRSPNKQFKLRRTQNINMPKMRVDG